MHTEPEIRRAIKILLEEYGALNTSEIKDHLNEVLLFDSEDLKLSVTRRGEPLILQRIGNIVSHQNEDAVLYEEGYVVDKSVVPAQWTLIQGPTQEFKPLSRTHIIHRRNRMGQYNKSKYKKINWEEINERQSAIGIAGEEFVYQNEIDLFRSINQDLLPRILHLSAMQGDGFGYDILSVDEDGISKYIEVKTTTSNNPYSPFYMSINERHFFEENIRNNAFIYRVYSFDMETRRGEIMIISAEELLNNFDFDPISFRVTFRG